MSVFRAAKTLGHLSGWSQSNLALQKTLYIAQMIHLSRHDRPLFEEPFEAWDYGPAVHALHDVAKRFGRHPVQDVFPGEVFRGSSTEARAISEAWEIACSMTAGQLVTYTHRPGGAWEQVYQTQNGQRVTQPRSASSLGVAFRRGTSVLRTRSFLILNSARPGCSEARATF